MNAMGPELKAERFSPLVLARICGGIGLFGIASGAFDIGYVHSHIMASGNALATAQNLLAHQTMFHSGIALHLLMVLLNVVSEVVGFYIFRRVNPLIATLALCCGLVGAATESLDMLGSVLPLQIGGAGIAGAFTVAQQQALSYLSLQLQDTGLLIAFLFWGLDELVTGYLIFRCGFLPRILGVLLGVSGFLYLLDPLLTFGVPALGTLVFPSGLFLCFPGEFLTSLWLATVGLNVSKWHAWRAPQQATLAAYA